MLAALTPNSLVSNRAFDVNGNKFEVGLIKRSTNVFQISESLDTSNRFDTFDAPRSLDTSQVCDNLDEYSDDRRNELSLDIINQVDNILRESSSLIKNIENKIVLTAIADSYHNVVGGNCFALTNGGVGIQPQRTENMSEPIPSTSKDEEPQQRDDLHESHARQARATFNVPRKSLPLIPRMNQYERHPLLQMKYGESGLSEFDMFVMDRESCALRRGSSITSRERQGSDTDYDDPECSRSGLFGDRKLIPRSAHSEVHPLFSRSDSGMCELEQYLIEKENEVTSFGASVSGSTLPTNGKQSTAAATASSSSRRPGERVLERRSTIGKLEPRTSQCERHALLEVRDEFGLSEMEKALQEKHEERLEKGKCCTDSTCKNSRCPKCKILNISTAGGAGDISLSSAASQVDDTSRLITTPTGSVVDPANVELTSKPSGTGSSKRVRFQYEKNETDNSDNRRGSASDNAPRISVETIDSQILGKGSTTGGKLPNASKKSADNGDQQLGAVKLPPFVEKNKKQSSDNKTSTDVNDRRTAVPKKSCCVS